MLTDARHTDLPAPEALARELSARLEDFQSIAWTASTGSTNAALPAPEAMERGLSAWSEDMQSIAWTASTGATSGDLLGCARAGAGTWLLGTHLQQTGRGRAGRPWQNRSGAALMFSCAFPVRMPASRLPALSPLAGMAACEALRSLAGGAPGLCVKW